MTGERALPEIVARLEALEAESAVRRVMTDYMRLCDSLGPDTPMDELGALFTANALWEGKGARYGATFGRHEGREAIVAMLDAYRGPEPHFAMNAHFLASETIAVEGETAKGSWMMLQTSTYASGTSDLRAARLEVSFAREDGRWRIAHFQTGALFSRPVDHWDSAAPVPVPTRSGE